MSWRIAAPCLLALCASACSLDLDQIPLRDDDAGPADGGDDNDDNDDNLDGGQPDAGATPDGDGGGRMVGTTTDGGASGDGDGDGDGDGKDGGEEQDSAAGDGDGDISEPLTILSLSPADKEFVGQRATVTVVFSRALDPSTVDDNSLELRWLDADGAPVPSAVVLDGATLTLTPHRPLHLLGRYELHVDEDVGADGVTLGTRSITTLSVVGGMWGTTVRIADPDPVSAIDAVTFPDGSALAVFVANDGARGNLWWSRYDPEGSWTAPALVETADGDVTQPQLAGDALGNAIAVWDQVDTRRRVYHALYDAVTGWTGPAAAENKPGLDRSEEAHVAMNEAGQAVLCWENWQSGGATSNVWARYYDPDTGFTGSQAMDVGSTGSETYCTIGPDGVADVIFEEGATSAAAVRRYVPGTGWEAMLAEVGGSADVVADPYIAASAHGTLLASFARDDASDGFRAYVTLRVPGASWSTARRVSNTSGTGDITVVGAVGTGGEALVVWPQLNERMNSNYYDPALGWLASSEVVAPSLATPAFEPYVVVDALGHGHASWLGGSPRDLIVAHRKRGAGWLSNRALDTLSSDATNGALRLWPDGRVLSVWVQGGDPWFNIFD